MSNTGAQKTFRLGRTCFRVVGAEAASLRGWLDVLLPACSSPTDKVVEISGVQDLRSLLNEVLRYHDGLLWLDAACLVSPAGRTVIIAGRSGAGKSTIAIALAFEYGWTVLSEDLVLIDPFDSKIVSFASPFSLKPGTIDLLTSSIGNIPHPIVDREWVPNTSAAGVSERAAEFDLALYFQASLGDALACSGVSPGAYVRAVMPGSNLVQGETFCDCFYRCLGHARCARVAGGSLAERLGLILDLESQCSTERDASVVQKGL